MWQHRTEGGLTSRGGTKTPVSLSQTCTTRWSSGSKNSNMVSENKTPGWRHRRHEQNYWFFEIINRRKKIIIKVWGCGWSKHFPWQSSLPWPWPLQFLQPCKMTVLEGHHTSHPGLPDTKNKTKGHECNSVINITKYSPSFQAQSK